MLHNSPDIGPSAPLTPPLSGQWPLEEARQNYSSTSRPFFAPSPTPVMVHYNLSTPRHRVRRLRYWHPETKTSLSYVYKYPVEEIQEEVIQPKGGSWIDDLDKILEEMEAKDREAAEKMASGQEDDAGMEAEAEMTMDTSNEYDEYLEGKLLLGGAESEKHLLGEEETEEHLQGGEEIGNELPDGVETEADPIKLEIGAVSIEESEGKMNDSLLGEREVSNPTTTTGPAYTHTTPVNLDMLRSMSKEVDMMMPDRRVFHSDLQLTDPGPSMRASV
jgi:hypothetical protein